MAMDSGTQIGEEGMRIIKELLFFVGREAFHSITGTHGHHDHTEQESSRDHGAESADAISSDEVAKTPVKVVDSPDPVPAENALTMIYYSDDIVVRDEFVDELSQHGYEISGRHDETDNGRYYCVLVCEKDGRAAEYAASLAEQWGHEGKNITIVEKNLAELAEETELFYEEPSPEYETTRDESYSFDVEAKLNELELVAEQAGAEPGHNIDLNLQIAEPVR